MPLSNNILSKYLTENFVETGSLVGDGIQKAIDSGYKNIYSIELSNSYYNVCKDRFKLNANVNLIYGDSAEVLKEVIKGIDGQITFWLDGHHSGGDTALGNCWSPLIQELDQIKNHEMKNHNILIDDMRCWEVTSNLYDFCKDDILKKLKEINVLYEFIYEDGFIKDDILVAKVPL